MLRLRRVRLLARMREDSRRSAGWGGSTPRRMNPIASKSTHMQNPYGTHGRAEKRLNQTRVSWRPATIRLDVASSAQIALRLRS